MSTAIECRVNAVISLPTETFRAELYVCVDARVE